MLAFFSASAYLNARRAAVTFSLAALLTSASSLGAQERELSKIERGQQLFEHAWKTGSDPQAGADGLGPLYNERSCVACHQLGGVGGAGPNSVNVKLLTVSVGGATRLSIARSGCKGSGTIVLHRFSSGRHAVFPFLDDLVNLGPADKPIPALKPIHMALRRQSPMHAVKQIKGSDDTFEITERNTTPLFGLG
ncbi:MAG TPA: di-heme oxidoredictase family protein, partial [Pirellulales bacterium]|nr:di-heme oxidoredictase family protein [Pirellulales bacterium]